MKIFYVLLTLIFSSTLTAEVIIDDDYSSKKLATRKAARGVWKVQDNSISCSFDEALYKKYNNHGPMVRYAFDNLSDLSIEMEVMLPAKMEKIVFKVDNGDGHIVKVLLGPTGKGNVRAFASKKESAVLGKIACSVEEGKWLPIKLSFSGNKLAVSLNGSKLKVFEHASFQKGKTKFEYTFVKGNIKARNFKISQP